MDEIAVFLAARLDEAEAAANGAAWCPDAATWAVIDRGELNPLTGRPRTMGGDIRFAIADSLDERVTQVDAEAADDGGVARHIALNDPAAVLAGVEADRALLAMLAAAREFSDRMFGSAAPGGIAPGEVLGQRTRAAAQVITMERVIQVRAARFSSHPDYRHSWLPG